MEKLTKAKANLVLDNPFFASLLLSMKFIEIVNPEPDDTYATDGENVFYNPKFVDSLTVSENTFVLAHEVLHAALEHCLRIGEKDADDWNVATDYVINDLLTKETGVGTMPKCGLLNSKLVQDGGGTAEGVYNLIMNQKPKQKEQQQGNNQGSGKQQQGKQGQNQQQQKTQGPKGFDKVKAPSKDQTTLNNKAAEMKVKVAQARDAAKMRGKLSSGLEKIAEKCLETETDWKTVLRNFVSQFAKTDLSYAKPKKRYIAEEIYLPSLIGEKVGKITIPVDCSGSIFTCLQVLEQFEGEIKAIIQDVGPSEIQVIYFDAKVLRIDSFKGDEIENFSLKPIGGGGTAFSPIFERISELETTEGEALPVACIVLTDLECSDFGEPPSYPVLWASTERNPDSKRVLPFGETVYLRKEKL